MTLKLELRAHESLQIGKACRLTNGPDRAVFVIEGNILVLRQKHMLTSADVVDGATGLYFLVQEIGLNGIHSPELVEMFLRAVNVDTELSESVIDEISTLLRHERFYAALTILRNLF